jgi:hypothetical protein
VHGCASLCLRQATTRHLVCIVKSHPLAPKLDQHNDDDIRPTTRQKYPYYHQSTSRHSPCRNSHKKRVVNTRHHTLTDTPPSHTTKQSATSSLSMSALVARSPLHPLDMSAAQRTKRKTTARINVEDDDMPAKKRSKVDIEPKQTNGDTTARPSRRKKQGKESRMISKM